MAPAACLDAGPDSRTVCRVVIPVPPGRYRVEGRGIPREVPGGYREGTLVLTGTGQSG